MEHPHACLETQQPPAARRTAPDGRPGAVRTRRARPGPMTARSGDSVLPGSGRPRPSAEWQRTTHSPALRSFPDVYLGGTAMGSYALPRPVVRRKLRGLLLALVVGVLGTGGALAAPPTAQAAESTLGAAAAQSGRYFGT